MTESQFRDSLQLHQPPEQLSTALRALWHDARGDWEEAHRLVQDGAAGELAWVHAYLHRKEGDLANADYWYRRAGRQRPDTSLEQEASEMISTLLGQ